MSWKPSPMISSSGGSSGSPKVSCSRWITWARTVPRPRGYPPCSMGCMRRRVVLLALALCLVAVPGRPGARRAHRALPGQLRQQAHRAVEGAARRRAGRRRGATRGRRRSRAGRGDGEGLSAGHRRAAPGPGGEERVGRVQARVPPRAQRPRPPRPGAGCAGRHAAAVVAGPRGVPLGLGRDRGVRRAGGRDRLGHRRAGTRSWRAGSPRPPSWAPRPAPGATRTGTAPT